MQEAIDPPECEPVYLAIGGNLGDREETFAAALRALEAHPEICVVAVSPVIESEPVGPGPQPRYLNAALRLETQLEPQPLLEVLQSIEMALGRDRSSQSVRWGARVLDLDLLFYGERIIETTTLVVPHPRAAERVFVMRPMAALAPDWRHPERGETMRELLQRFSEAEAASVWAWPAFPGWRVAQNSDL